MVTRAGSVIETIRVDQLADLGERVHVGARAEVFDTIYANAEGDATRVPWGAGRAHPMLVRWLNHDAPRLVRPGSRAVVIGCGLGDDVTELVRRGYDAVGFDCSPTAIKWAARRNPSCAQRYLVADLLDLPQRFACRFDLVVEICTLQSIEPEMQPAAMQNIARLVSPRGVVLTVGRGCEHRQEFHREDGPPWPVCPDELVKMAAASGMAVRTPPTVYVDDELPSCSMVISAFMRC